MKPIWTSLIALTTLLALPVPGSSQGQAPRERGPKHVARAAQAAEDPNHARVIVKFKADGALMREAAAAAGSAAAQRPQHAARLAQRLGLPLADGRVVAPRVQVLRSKGIGSAELVARLARDPDVEYAEIDQRVTIKAAPNDPLYPDGLTSTTPAVGQWYLRPPDATVVSAINAQSAWDITVGSPSITVAVLDTGVRLDHPDLAGKLHPGYDFVHDAPTAGDGQATGSEDRDGDPSDPGDWTTYNQCGGGADDVTTSSWHGTQVSGLIGAATDNGIGMAGVGRNVMVLPVRVLGKCGGFQSDIVAAMRWAAGLAVPGVSLNPNTARVINLSLGSPPDTNTSTGCSNTYQDAVTELTNARVAVVVAAGNDAGLAANQPSNCTGAIGVAGVRHIGTKVGYSNVGPQVAVAAPAGNCVNLLANQPCLYPLLTSTNNGATTPLTNTYSDSGDSASIGTSFATPLVSGTVALMLSANPELTPAQVKQAVWNTARTFPSTGAGATVAACREPNGIEQIECYCTTTTCGAGLLDAAAAVTRATGAPIPTVNLSVAPTLPAIGQAIQLSAAGATPVAGRSIVAYEWQITGGGSFARIASSTNGSTATVATTATGTFSVRLTVTDSAGETATDDRFVTVTLAPPPSSGSSSNDSGGGALGAPWLLALALAVFSLARPARRR